MIDPPFAVGPLGCLTVGLRDTPRTQFLCPFCREAISEVGLFYDMAATEATLRSHILERHPIRWRLNRRFRAAVRAGR